MAPTVPTRKQANDFAATKPSKPKVKNETASKIEKTKTKTGVISGRVEKTPKKSSDTDTPSANTSAAKASNIKTAVDEDYYDHHPMDKDFRFSKEVRLDQYSARIPAKYPNHDLEDPAYRQQHERLTDFFHYMAQWLDMCGRMKDDRTQIEKVFPRLPVLVGQVTGGRYGLMKDLVTCRRKIGEDGDGKPIWGDPSDVKHLETAFVKDVNNGTAFIAMDMRAKAKEQKEGKNPDADAQSAVDPSSTTTPPPPVLPPMTR